MEPSPERTEFQEELRSMEQSLARISRLLGPAEQHRVMGDIERRCLLLVEMEMSSIVAFLKWYPPKLRDDAFCDYEDMREWLQKLFDFAKRILESTDPRGYTLLDRAVVYCCCRNPNSSAKEHRNQNSLLRMTEDYLIETEDPRRYMLQLVPHWAAATPRSRGLLPTQSAETGDVPLFGMDQPIKKLLRWLVPQRKETAESNHTSVMAVLGPFGIGKTTLAIKLHNTFTDGGRCFHLNIMARLSKGRDGIKLLLQEILSQISDQAALALSSDHQQPTTMDEQVSCVSKLLQNKRYFICIDDIAEASEWRKIKDAFPNNGLGSRILITSRVRSTAWSCFSDSNGIVHEMKPLNLVDSKELLITRAFGSLDAVLPNSVKQLMDKILLRCDGIPLFINGMADWLKEKTQLQWHQEYEEELEGQVPKQLLAALSSVYDDLPYDLKIQSLYVSMFPYGYKFDKHHIETTAPHRQRTYDPAFYLSKLVDWNIVTKITYKSDPDEDEVGQWHVNHFMHLFLSHKSTENIGFAFTSDTLHHLEALPASKGPRRISLHNPNPKISVLVANEKLCFSETRSLAISGAVNGISFSKFKNLLQLDLKGWENLTDANLQQVCKSKMFFLQYLSLRNTHVTKLPEEIKEMCNLKVLDISNTLISELPLEVFNLKVLDELDIRGTRIIQLPKQIVGLQSSLSVLLLGDEGIAKTTRRVLHDDVWSSSELETPVTVDLKEQPVSLVNALGDISGLLVLAIKWSFLQCTDQDYHDALLSSIQKLYKLKSLTINCELGCSMEFLGSVSNPPETLEKFKVTNGRFICVPKWIGELQRLTFVQITVWKQSTKDLKVLGGLPSLLCLILGLEFIPLEDVVIESEGFLKLERFSVHCPDPWLRFSTEAMQNLRYLQLKFGGIPARKNSVPSGIRCLKFLTEVDLRYNVRYANSPSVKNIVEAVREQVENHPNPMIELFINGELQGYDVQATADEATEMGDGVQPVVKDVMEVAETISNQNQTNQNQSICEIEEVENDG